ncbi:MAG: ABC transporter substrate-binding protein [Cyanobacteriota bacterium]
MKFLKISYICIITILLFGILLLNSCKKDVETQKQSSPKVTLVFKHYDIQSFSFFGGRKEFFTELIKEFEKTHPNIDIKEELLPASSDLQHQFYVINLEGKTEGIDIIGLDVIWVKEFAKAGWIKDLTGYLEKDEYNDFIPVLVEANSFEDKLYAIPWMFNSGLLYYRKDLLDKYKLKPPETYQELLETADYILKKENNPDLYGFLWQGKQYEGLVCNALEFIYGNGGKILINNDVVIDSIQTRQALDMMRKFINTGVSPDLVKTANEGIARKTFLNGNAIFIRDWAYSNRIINGDKSPLKGLVAFSNVPHFPNKESSPILGGYQLGINKYSRHPDEAYEFIKFITSPEAQKHVAIYGGYKPSRKSLYKDKELLKVDPYLEEYYDKVIPTVKPRPLSPFYIMFSNILQSEFSAIIGNLRTSQDCLYSAKKQIQYILDVEKRSKG